ncbi:hypothetical protein OAJ17_02105 [Acidimicrobiaceae bacterium]|nr:hypothetical protein [Acidimicrobiaceae bacterium]
MKKKISLFLLCFLVVSCAGQEETSPTATEEDTSSPSAVEEETKENSQVDEEGHDDHDEEGHDDHDDHDEEGHDDHKDDDDHDEEGHDDHDEEGHDDHDEEETPATVVVYNKGEIIDVTGAGSEFYKREVTINGVRIVAAGNVGGQQAVPDAFLEKVARMVELFTDPNSEGIDAASQINFIKTLNGAPGTYHAGIPTLQRVARGGGDDYSSNFLRTPESFDLDYINDSTYNNDMVWYLNSSGEGFGNGDIDAAEVIEHVFHTIHMSGLDALALKQYSEFSSDWANGPVYSAMKEAYDGGLWDSEGYGGDAWKTDPEMFRIAQKEYLYLLNFSMFEYTSLWENGTLSPEWNDSMRTPSGILTNNPLGYELYNTYIAPAISKPDLSTIRDIFQDGDVGDPTVAGSSGY